MASIIKKINHNTLLVEDNGIEKVVMGRGIGFRATPNRRFDMKSADKVYVLESREISERFIQVQGSNSHILEQYM